MTTKLVANQEGPAQSKGIFSCCKGVNRVINTLVCAEKLTPRSFNSGGLYDPTVESPE